MLHLYLPEDERKETCFNVQCSGSLTIKELEKLKRILAKGFVGDTVKMQSCFTEQSKVVEIGPLMNYATQYNTNMLSIFQAVGLSKVQRIERSRRILVEDGDDAPAFDRMTECIYDSPIETFETGRLPEPVKIIPLLEKGPDALEPFKAMDNWDREYYFQYFSECDREPTDVELTDLNNANSEHSRHGFFKGKMVIDGIEMPETLMQLVMSTLWANRNNSVIAFNDNSSGIVGYDVTTILPYFPGKASPFEMEVTHYDIILTAETHNFPTGVAPLPGAETGTGGRIRDIQATGRGGLVIAGTAGYCVGNLNIPGYKLVWEAHQSPIPGLAIPLSILIEASNGASDYGNKFGEPVIQGFVRSFDQDLPDCNRWAFLKPIMFTGGIGQIDSRHIKKRFASKGLLIVQIGGPAYRIGVGGGAASSSPQGENKTEIDFNAVQRGDAEMAQKVNRVVRACSEMNEHNPIYSIHDQGAGGPANVLKELVEESGGRVELRRINVADPTMSVLEIWVAEYQERNGLLIHSERIREFQEICVREKVNCEVLGEVTGDGRFIVHDEQDDTTPVDFELDKLMGKMPQKTYYDNRVPTLLFPVYIPEDLSFKDAINMVVRNVSVGSKTFLTNKVDRSVTGLIAQQQCCGPMQLPVADVAVVAQSHFGLTGAATAIGEQSIKMLVNPAAGARMAVAEALTNIVWAKVSDLSHIKVSANWMWAPKLPGEGAALYDAAEAMRGLMIELGIAVDGGKDSLSMATIGLNGEMIKSPRELVISAYCTMDDIRKKVTPDIKYPGQTHLLYVDLSGGQHRLGGSIFAQVLKQIGDVSPDVNDPTLLWSGLNIIQELIAEGKISAGHDVSDGGLISTLLEMAFAGNCGFKLSANSSATLYEYFFAEEPGVVIEVSRLDTKEVVDRFAKRNITTTVLGITTKVKKLYVAYNHEPVFKESMMEVREWWGETSYQIERLQANPECVDQEKKHSFDRPNPIYHATFHPEKFHFDPNIERIPVAILRDEGSNGDREMTSAFYMAGFMPWDINMQDILSGAVNLGYFRGLAAVGGFSYADCPSSAKGWAAQIRENPEIQKQFKDFYERPDTFSLGVCNGCQLFALLGWVPWSGISDEDQPRFEKNKSGRFESRWSSVRIMESPAIMFKGMTGSVLGVPSAHGEGRLYFPNEKIRDQMIDKKLVSLSYVNDEGRATDAYPFCPNGSPYGIGGICSSDGRHVAMMPHPERVTADLWQWHYLPKENQKKWPASPWLQMFLNALYWCNVYDQFHRR